MRSPAQPSPFERPIKFPNVLVNTVDEESPLLGHADGGTREDQLAEQGGGNPLTASVMAILLLGELISHADTTLIFAAAPQIASELGSLRGVGWLATSYTLSVCSMQPLYGRLSDIFGRKAMLLFAYCILSIGCIICGTSTTLFQIIIGRAISGIGGAGVMTMASIIITDSVPKRDFAKYRSYINLATTLGRSIGGPIGGFISDYLGWQWLFWIRIPFFALSISLILISLKGAVDQTPDTDSDDSMQKESFRQKWRKVDYKGALLLTKAIVSLILLLDVAGTGTFSPSVAFLTASVVVFGHLFVFWELFGAETPIFNLRILAKPNATLSYLVDYFQVFAQVGMMFSVPMYFQVTQRASATASGAHIVPAVVANTFGALLSGKLMHISHRQKTILISTGILGASSYLLIFAFWNGHTSFWESLYVIPGGFATGLAQSAAFVSMASCLENQDLAMATGWFFLVSSLGTVSSVTVTNVMLQSSFRRNLERVIEDPDKDNLIEKVTSNINNIANLSGELRLTVVDAFVGSLKSGYISGFVACILSSCFAAFLRANIVGEHLE